MRFVVIVFVLLCAAAAQAQQPSPGEQALGSKLLQEIQSGLSCNTNLISVQAELAKAQTRIKELEPKPEEKK